MLLRPLLYLKSFALLIGFLFTLEATAQFTDDFSDLDFTNSPTWVGDDTIFEASTARLHLDAAPISSEAYLSTPSQAIENATWEFLVQMDFNPSASNLARVYLTADQPDLRNAVNGYFVEIGNTTDEVSLYRQDGTSDSEIIDGRDDVVDVSNVLVKVRVTRDNAGNWELFSDTTAAFSGYVSEGVVFDDTHTSANHSGVYCLYTSTRSDKFWFDDFDVTGTAITDTTPPEIASVAVVSATELDVFFSEPLIQASAESEGNYDVTNGIGQPVSAIQSGANPAQVTLTFGAPFPNGTSNTLTVTNVLDLAGNSIGNNNTAGFIYFVADSALFRDVVINEIMPDPSPVVGLPDAEYVELHNPTTKIFDLNGWQLSDGSSTATIGSYALLPGEYVIVVANADTNTFINNVTTRTIGVSSFPSLNNAGDNLTLQNANGDLIDQVNYSDDWYQDDAKDGGGWSLELINPELPCSNPFNWIASNNVNGGTPGSQNSVYNITADVTGPTLTNILVNASDTIVLVFDEALDSLSVLNATYSITGGLSVSLVQNVAPDYDRILLVLSPALTPGVVHEITITNLTDCSGNSLTTGATPFALDQEAAPGDVIINEVLFNPVNGGADFVEIYNNSDKIISLKNWKLANYDEDDDTISSFRDVTLEAFLLFPGEYLVLTTDPEVTWQTYLSSRQDRFLEMASLPTYSNDSATVYLINNLDSVSDRFSYDEDMHFGLLNDNDGVSLERIDFDRATNDPTNWHSAAENVDFATPGYENSQFYPTAIADDAVSIDPKVFSPDNDGYQDVVNISYALDGPGYVGNIMIFDSKGRDIRHLMRSELLATEGTISWDGTMENREKARSGIYVIFFEIFDLDGNVTHFKRTVVVGARLN